MSFLNFISIEELRKLANELDLDIEVSEGLIKQIRNFHFIRGYNYGDIRDELDLTSESLNKFFLKSLGYTDWDAYHKTRGKLLGIIDLEFKENVYVLKLEDNKWYIGKSINVKNAIKHHKIEKASEWTKKYKFISLEKVFEEGDVKQITLDYMRKFGWENVRGYAWSQVNMKNPPKALRKEATIVEVKKTSKKEEKEPVELKSDPEKGKYIDNLYFKWETEKAVKFKSGKDEKILWVPKSAINGAWIADRAISQKIFLKFIPKDFG